MTQGQVILTVAVVALGTILTRFVPFWVFPAGRERPAFVRYLGQVLPAAAMGLLVVYCYKEVSLSVAYLPEFVAGAVVVLLQWWKKNLFLSLVGGCAFFVLLLQLPL